MGGGGGFTIRYAPRLRGKGGWGGGGGGVGVGAGVYKLLTIRLKGGEMGGRRGEGDTQAIRLLTISVSSSNSNCTQCGCINI